MEALIAMTGFVGSITALAALWYVLRWLIAKKERKPVFRLRFFISIVAFVASAYVLGLLGNRVEEQEAKALGFTSAKELADAKEENISNPALWADFKADRALKQKQRKAEETAAAKLQKEKEIEQAKADAAAAEKQAKIDAEAAAKQAKLEAEAAEEKALADAKAKIAKAKACRRDLTCWGEKANSVATALCPSIVERLAKFDFEWTDGWLDPKFTHYRWRDIDAGTVTVIGGKIKFQNGFGAWSHMIYECDIEPVEKKVLDVRARAGRL